MSDASLLARGYELAESITRDRAKSFHFASRFLGRRTKARAFAVYAFCRRCDDTVDGAGAATATLPARLADLRAQVDDAYRGLDRGDPVLAAFSETVRATSMPKYAVLDLIAGMEQDLTKKRYATWEELLHYCQLAAGTVGIMMASVFGIDDERALSNAAALGRAMQLTNVLRDVREDLEQHDRIYLPQQALAAEGVTEADLRTFAARGGIQPGPVGEGFRAVMREGARRAGVLYHFGERGVPHIVNRTGRTTVRVMRATYAEILHVLEEQRWDPFVRRARTGTARKVEATALALLEAR
jgi:phytoene synthase